MRNARYVGVAKIKSGEVPKWTRLPLAYPSEGSMRIIMKIVLAAVTGILRGVKAMIFRGKRLKMFAN